MNAPGQPLRRLTTPVLARGLVLGASLVASSLLIRERGLGLFGLLATLLLLSRIGSALMLGESQLKLAQRTTTSRAVLNMTAFDLTRVLGAAALTAAGAAVATDRHGASTQVTNSFAAVTVVMAFVAALLRLSSIKLAQSGHTALSAVSDISVIAPVAALTFLISNLYIAALVQVLVLFVIGGWSVYHLVHGETTVPPPRATVSGDVVAFAVSVLPMLHGSIGPVLGVFGLDSDAVGLLAFAQRLASAAPLILAGAGATVLAVPIERSRATTIQCAKWGGIAFFAISVVAIAVWPIVRSVLDVEEIGVTVVALVFVANFINVASGPIGPYCAVAGRQNLDLISLIAAVIVLVPFVFFDLSATRAAVAAVLVAAVRAFTAWFLVVRANRQQLRSAPAPSAVGGVTVD